MWHGKKVAVVLPTYNERESICRATLNYFAQGLVQEANV